MRATCVPPHAETSKSSTSINRRTPSRFDSLRSGSLAASSASANRIVDRTVLPDDPVGLPLGARDLVGGDLAREIDCGRSRAEVEADGSDLEHAVERRRQHVLARVLLHVLEAARPVDPPCTARRDLAFDHCTMLAVVFVDDLDDAGGAERAGIERLAARGRIESRAVEHDAACAGVAGDRLDVTTVASNSVV